VPACALCLRLLFVNLMCSFFITHRYLRPS
jgi:hypothetical protein